MAKNYYQEIDKVLKEYETCKSYHMLDLEWACNRIDWCWKFKKITESEMDELTSRAIAILGG